MLLLSIRVLLVNFPESLGVAYSHMLTAFSTSMVLAHIEAHFTARVLTNHPLTSNLPTGQNALQCFNAGKNNST